MIAGSGSGVLALGIYLLAGASFARFWGQESPVPAPAQVVPASSLPELREDLAQRLFCTPCPEVEACEPAPPVGWAPLACALLLGVAVGGLCTICCCGTAVAGFAFGHHGNRPRVQNRFTAPRPILW